LALLLPEQELAEQQRKQGKTPEMLQLLHDVSGVFQPAILTALVGVSGAGKTTLLDVLAGRKSSESP
jgi:ABC-type multidrug transport system ATPase subunit